MILPSKHLHQDRALLTVGAQILERLESPKTVSSLWEELRPMKNRPGQNAPSPSLSYDWFVLALDLLYTLGAVDLKRGLVSRELR
jgi:hypothetical protein